jgi:hypothetical protein
MRGDILKIAIHYKQDGSVDWVGNVIEKSKTHVVIQCVDAICLFCDIWSLSNQQERVLSSECCFFDSMVAAKNACDTANEYFGN